MASNNDTPLIHTPANSEAPRARSRSPAVIERLSQTYPTLDKAIQSEESCRAVWVSHQSQFIHEVKALSEAHTDSETTIEELRRSLANLSQRVSESEAQHGKVLSENYDLLEAHARMVKEKDAIINALSLRAQGES